MDGIGSMLHKSIYNFKCIRQFPATSEARPYTDVIETWIRPLLMHGTKHNPLKQLAPS